MEIIYIVAFEISLILFGFMFLPFNLCIILSSIFIVGLYIFNSNKNIFLILLPFLFLLRAIFIFDYSIKVGDIKEFQVFNYGAVSKIEKIDTRYPLKNSYLSLSNCKEGEYLVVAEVKNISKKYNNLYYEIDVLKLESVIPNRVQQYFQERSNSLLKNFDYDFRRVFQAVILGENYRLSREMRAKFNYIGISHLMALSGFHITLVISLFSFLLSFKLPLKKRERNMLLLVLLTIYYLGVQHSPSLNRAYIMGAIYLSGKIFNENTELAKSLVFSYVISLIINPASILSISFQLSYGAVLAIVGFFPWIKTKIYKGKSKVIEGILLTLSIQLFLTPLLIKNFGVVQVLSFISNIFVLPIGSIVISLSFIALLLENIYLGSLVVPLLNFVYYVFSRAVNLFYSIPLMSIEYKDDSILLTLFYPIFLVIVFILKFRKDSTKNEKIFKRTKISQ